MERRGNLVVICDWRDADALAVEVPDGYPVCIWHRVHKRAWVVDTRRNRGERDDSIKNGEYSFFEVESHRRGSRYVHLVGTERSCNISTKDVGFDERTVTPHWDQAPWQTPATNLPRCIQRREHCRYGAETETPSGEATTPS